MKGNFITKSVPTWLLSFLFVNVLYIFFKDVVFYFVFILLYSTILYLKIKNKSSFIMLEVLVFTLNLIILIICAINSEQIVLKMILMNLEIWFFVYLFSKKTIN